MKRSLVACYALVCVVLMLSSSTVSADQTEGQPTSPSNIGETAANEAGTTSYLFTWTATATGYKETTLSSGTRQTDRETVRVSGSKILRYKGLGPDGTPNGTIEGKLLSHTVNLETEYTQDGVMPDGCPFHITIRNALQDPNGWTGLQQTYRDGFQNLIPKQHADGRWYFSPMATDMILWGTHAEDNSTHYTFTRRTQVDEDSCHPRHETTSQRDGRIVQSIVTKYLDTPDGNTLQGDSTGSSFSLNRTFTSNNKNYVTVKWNITGVRLGGCAGRSSAIDINDAVVNHVDVALDAPSSSIRPDSNIKLQARVTCDGVPVKNAALTVESKVIPKSGGHLHDDADRPRGCLNGTKITKATPSITAPIVTVSDANGVSPVLLQPGVPQPEKCGVARGIAGTYEITVKVNNFPDRVARRVIEVERKDFIHLPLPGNHYGIDRGDFAIHPEGTWGATGTIIGVANLANDFWAAQEQHNQELAKAGKPVWPLTYLSVNDISLRKGGLFDVVGFDINLQKVTGKPWDKPHLSHRDGTGVDLNSFRGNVHRDWLMATLRTLGRNYGRWETREPTLHLEFGPGASANTAPIRQAATQPDLGVSIFQTDEADHLYRCPRSNAGIHHWGRQPQWRCRSTCCHGDGKPSTWPSFCVRKSACEPFQRGRSADLGARNPFSACVSEHLGVANANCKRSRSRQRTRTNG